MADDVIQINILKGMKMKKKHTLIHFTIIN